MSSGNHSRYSPDSAHPVPLFIDTGPIFAYYYPKDRYHDDASEVFDAIKSSEVSWGPLITNDFVLDEVFTHLEDLMNKQVALKTIRSIYAGGLFSVKKVDRSEIKTTLDYIEERIDHGHFDGMGFTDWVIYTQMKEHRRSIDHIFTYDREDFSDIDVTVIPYHTL